jgi:hypothetical protein
MAILLNDIPLPSLLKVTKAWSPVEENRFYSGDGILVLQQQTRNGGQPIVLAGEKVNNGVMGVSPYSLYLTLADLVTAGREMTLSLHGETFPITWDFQQIPLEYEPILYRRPPASDDPVLLTLRFLTLPT